MNFYPEGTALYQTSPNYLILSSKARGFKMIQRRVVTRVKRECFYLEILEVHIVLVKKIKK